MDVHFKHSRVNNEPTVRTVIPESPKFRLQTDRLSVYQFFHAIASLRGHRANSQTEDVDAFLFFFFFKPNEAKICFLEIAENSPLRLFSYKFNKIFYSNMAARHFLCLNMCWLG